MKDATGIVSELMLDYIQIIEQRLHVRSHFLIALTGKAGTGKTLLALAAALGKLTDYKQILLARPIVALSNKDLGFLPGDDGLNLMWDGFFIDDK